MENPKPREITEHCAPIPVGESASAVRLSSVASKQIAATGHFLFSLFQYHSL
jgi:hypothetical protein